MADLLAMFHRRQRKDVWLYPGHISVYDILKGPQGIVLAGTGDDQLPSGSAYLSIDGRAFGCKVKDWQRRQGVRGGWNWFLLVEELADGK